jgi:uncharacterized protein YndB with AHSA1/START domain
VDARTSDNDAFAMTMPSDRELVFTRVFNAPRQRVFDAWTKPEHLVRWYGCHSSSLVVCEVDLRVGGSYCFVARMADGTEHALSGVYRDIAPPERLVFTQRFNDDPDKEALVALLFEERHGKTTMTMTALYRSAEDRQAVLDIGVARGTTETFERLAALLADQLADTRA